MNFSELKTRFNRTSIPIAYFVVAGATYACSWQEVKFVGLAIPITLITAALLYAGRIYYNDPEVKMNRIEKWEKKLFSEVSEEIQLEKKPEQKPAKNSTLQPVTTRRGPDGQLYVVDPETGYDMTVENFVLRDDIEKKLKK
ncbi:MAG: hypothetical protein WC894_00530 [Patescibacteria group bacterium]